MSTARELNALTDAIIGAAIQVHKEVGPRLLESAYQQHLLLNAGLQVEAEHPVPLKFRRLQLETAYRLDLLVDSTFQCSSTASNA